MQVTRKDISETKVALTIVVDEAELTKAKEAALKQLAKTVKAQGFRPGKAPLAVVEKQLDANRLEPEVLQEAVNSTYQNAITEHELRTLSNPEVEITSFVPYTALTYTATVEVLPKVKLGDYKKIKKTLNIVEATDAEVTEVIDNLRGRSSTKKAVERAARDGDEVVIDFEGTDEKGELVAGASGTDYGLVLGSKSFIPGFEEGLIGVKAGDVKDLKLSFPKDYHADNLAGTKINFKTTVKTVNEVVLPKADDEFAKSVGPFEKMTELKKDVKAQLEEQKVAEATNKLKDEIVEELVKKSTFALPEVLVSDQVAMLEHDFRQNLMYRGITPSEYFKQEKTTEEEWKKAELVPQAERRVSVGIVLAEVAQAEKLTVSDAELAERISVYKQQYGKQADQFDQPDMQREVASRLLTEKTVDHLYELATA